MAFTQSNLTRNVIGNQRIYSGTFTSAAGDNTLTVTHGMYFVTDVDVQINMVGAQVPSVSTSGGASTVVWDDTQGASGSFTFIGR